MEAERFYHIYNRANGFENLYLNEENFRFFLEKWALHTTPIAHTYAYCLMPNHFHCLVRIKSEAEVQDHFGFKKEAPFGKYPTFEKLLSKQFANLFSSYTQAFNKMYGRTGSLFSPNFKSKEITSDNYLTNVIFYIHHNPVHHGFTETIADWQHSSYHALFTAQQTKLKREEVNEWFGGVEATRDFHNQSIENLESLEKEMT